jgi:hypothetical protein
MIMEYRRCMRLRTSSGIASSGYWLQYAMAAVATGVIAL